MTMLARSFIPRLAPRAQMLSYSGPSVTPSAGCLLTLPHPIGQEKHGLFSTRYFSARASPLCSYAYLNTPVWKLFVGYRPFSFIMLTRTAVPYFGRPSPVMEFSLSFLIFSFTTSRNFVSFATFTFCDPLTTTALRFFDPMTAPTPLLPAALCSLFIMLANLTSFSPAGPIHATCALGSPNSSSNIFVVSLTVLPQRWDASLISTSLSFILM